MAAESWIEHVESHTPVTGDTVIFITKSMVAGLD